MSAPVSLLRFLNLSCFSSFFSAGIAPSLLLSAVWVSHEAGSLPPSVFSYTTVIGCIHRHTVGTHAPAACSDVAANTTTVPCTVSAHTLTVLSGYVVSVIVRAHFRASCLRLYWLPSCTKFLLGHIRLQHSEHTELRKTDIYI